MIGLANLPFRVSAQDFLDWEPGDGLRYELVHGEPRAMAPAGTIHGFLQNELGRLVGNHLRERGSQCEVLAGQGTLADPVILVEILSPGNQAKTWSDVWPTPASRASRKSWFCTARGSKRSCCAAGPRPAGQRGPNT